jgi:two-component system sensor histidine kinase/response regulator
MKILIVEDEPVIRMILQEMLELNGHQVTAAADGNEAIRIAAQGPEIIFCDIGLPGKDGYEVLTAVRALPNGHDISFILLSGYVDPRDQRRGMALGADDYIFKPFSEKDITDAINARVARQRALRERND